MKADAKRGARRVLAGPSEDENAGEMDESVYQVRCALETFCEEYQKGRIRAQEYAIGQALKGLKGTFPYLERVNEQVIPALLDLAKRYVGDMAIGEKSLILLDSLCFCNKRYLDGICPTKFWEFGNVALRRVGNGCVNKMVLRIGEMLMRNCTSECSLQLDLLIRNLEESDDAALVPVIMNVLSYMSEQSLNDEVCEKLWRAINVAIGKSDKVVAAVAKILIDITNQRKMNVDLLLKSPVMGFLADKVGEQQNVLLLFITLLSVYPDATREFRFVELERVLEIVGGSEVLRPYALTFLACVAEYQNVNLCDVMPESIMETMVSAIEASDFVMKRTIARVIADLAKQSAGFVVQKIQFDTLNHLFLDVVECSGNEIVLLRIVDAVVALFEHMTRISMDVNILKPLMECIHEKIMSLDMSKSPTFAHFITVYTGFVCSSKE